MPKNNAGREQPPWWLFMLASLLGLAAGLFGVHVGSQVPLDPITGPWLVIMSWIIVSISGLGILGSLAMWGDEAKNDREDSV